jgi:hypothetical protein
MPLKDYNFFFVDTIMTCNLMAVGTKLVALTILKTFIYDCCYILYMLNYTFLRNWIRIVGIATGLQAGGYEVQIPVGARHYITLHSSLPQNVQTGSGAHLTSYSMGTGIPFLR